MFLIESLPCVAGKTRGGWAPGDIGVEAVFIHRALTFGLNSNHAGLPAHFTGDRGDRCRRGQWAASWAGQVLGGKVGLWKASVEGGLELEQQGEGVGEGDRKRPVLGRGLGCWMPREEIPFLQQAPELSSFRGSPDDWGTDAEKVTFRHRLSVVNYAIISTLQIIATRGRWSASL